MGSGRSSRAGVVGLEISCGIYQDLKGTPAPRTAKPLRAMLRVKVYSCVVLSAGLEAHIGRCRFCRYYYTRTRRFCDQSDGRRQAS